MTRSSITRLALALLALALLLTVAMMAGDGLLSSHDGQNNATPAELEDASPPGAGLNLGAFERSNSRSAVPTSVQLRTVPAFITDEYGNRVGSVIVSTLAGSQRKVLAHVGENGEFVVEGAPETLSTDRVVVEDNFGALPLTAIDCIRSEPTGGVPVIVRIVVQRGGRVRWVAGGDQVQDNQVIIPVAARLVFLSDGRSRPEWLTGAAGPLPYIQSMPAGVYTFTAVGLDGSLYCPGRTGCHVPVGVFGGGEVLQLSLNSLATSRRRVQIVSRDSGLPLVGAQLTIHVPGNGCVEIAAVTDDNGYADVAVAAANRNVVPLMARVSALGHCTSSVVLHEKSMPDTIPLSPTDVGTQLVVDGSVCPETDLELELSVLGPVGFTVRSQTYRVAPGAVAVVDRLGYGAYHLRLRFSGGGVCHEEVLRISPADAPAEVLIRPSCGPSELRVTARHAELEEAWVEVSVGAKASEEAVRPVRVGTTMQACRELSQMSAYVRGQISSDRWLVPHVVPVESDNIVVDGNGSAVRVCCRDDDGRSLPNATVDVLDSLGRGVAVRTDASGHFWLHGLEADTYYIVPRWLMGGTIDPRLFRFSPSEIGEGEVATVVFPRVDGVICGRVATVAEIGATAAIAISSVWNESDVFKGPRSLFATQPTPVGDDGEFCLQGLPEGTYQIQLVVLQEAGEWQPLAASRAAVVTVGQKTAWKVSVEL